MAKKNLPKKSVESKVVHSKYFLSIQDINWGGQKKKAIFTDKELERAMERYKKYASMKRDD